jgi:hypothetical protein
MRLANSPKRRKYYPILTDRLHDLPGIPGVEVVFVCNISDVMMIELISLQVFKNINNGK